MTNDVEHLFSCACCLISVFWKISVQVLCPFPLCHLMNWSLDFQIELLFASSLFPGVILILYLIRKYKPFFHICLGHLLSFLVEKGAERMAITETHQHICSSFTFLSTDSLLEPLTEKSTVLLSYFSALGFCEFNYGYVIRRPKSSLVEYLHHRNWQTLEIKAFYLSWFNNTLLIRCVNCQTYTE